MPIARKEYQCDLCLLPIPAATKYILQRRGPWDGADDIYNWRTHVKCEAIARAMYRHLEGLYDDDGIGSEDFVELMEYLVDKIGQDAVDKLGDTECKQS